MIEPRRECLSERQLKLLGEGNLDDPLIERLSAHFDQCLHCQQAAAKYTSDSFLSDLVDPEKHVDVELLGDLLADILAQGPTAQDDIKFPKKIAGYEVLNHLGSGGMGTVFRVRRPNDGELLALKVLKQPQQLARFKDEYRKLHDITHQNLVALGHRHDLPETCCFSMEYVDGVDFKRFVRTICANDSADRNSELGHCLRQLFNGVGVLHARGMIHCDLKPSNVLVDHQGRVVILDFGLVKALQVDENLPDVNDVAPKRTTNSRIAGTPDYMAPERFQGDASCASDFYSIGVMLYEALTGEFPKLDEAKLKDGRRTLAEPKQWVPWISREVNLLCTRLLEHDPLDRPDVEEVFSLLGNSTEFEELARVSASLPFVGRNGLSSELDDALARSQNEQLGTVVLIRGESGIGKTRLVEEFLKRIVSGDRVILRGRCYEHEHVPYKGIDEVVDALAEFVATELPLHDANLEELGDVNALVKMFPALASASPFVKAGEDTASVDPSEMRQRALTCFRKLLHRVAARRTLVAWIDDLHWTDQESAQILEYLLTGDEPPPLMLILSFRTGEFDRSSWLSDLERALASSQTVQLRSLTVPRLEREAIEELLRRLHLAEAELQADSHWEHSRGNPYVLQRMIIKRHAWHDLSPPGKTATRNHVELGTVPIGAVLFEDIEQFDPQARRFVELLSIAARPMQEDAVWQMTGPCSTKERIAKQLRNAKLVRGVGSDGAIVYYHDMIRESVVALMSSEDTRARHFELASFLESQETADSGQIAYHFHQAGEIESAFHYYEIGGDQAEASLAFDLAAERYQQALTVCKALADPKNSSQFAWDLREKLAEALANAGRGREAANVYLQMSKALPDEYSIDQTIEQRARLERLAATQFLIGGHVDEGREELEKALRRKGMRMSGSPWWTILQLLYFETRLHWMLRKDPSNYERQPANRASLERAEICFAVMVGLGMIDVIQGALFQARYSIFALQSGDSRHIQQALSRQQGLYLAYDKYELRNPKTRRVQDYLNCSEDKNVQGMMRLTESGGAFIQGDWRRALEFSWLAEKFLTENCIGVQWELSTVQMSRIYSHFFLGNLGQMAEELPALAERARGRRDLYALNSMIEALCFLSFANDDPEHVAESLNELDRDLPSRREGYYFQHLNSLSAHVHLALYKGDGVQALALLKSEWRNVRRSQLMRVQFFRVTHLQIWARAYLRSFDHSRSTKALHRANRIARKLNREGKPYATAMATLIEAGLAAQRGKLKQAAELLQESVSACTTADLGLYRAAASYQLARLKGTCPEQSEAWMKGQGIKNPQAMSDMLVPGLQSTN